MSRKAKEETVTEATEATEAPAEEAPKVDKRQRIVTTPSGEAVNRTDYIRQLWVGEGIEEADKMTRSQIRDHIVEECTSENGENTIPYQIVFAATKGLAGGPSEAELNRRKEEKAATKAAAKAATKAEEDAAKATEGEGESSEG